MGITALDYMMFLDFDEECDEKSAKALLSAASAFLCYEYPVFYALLFNHSAHSVLNQN